MIKITKLTMKNFLSVGAVTSALNLDKNGLTLVLGANTDSNGGLTRNGAGKTTVLQAISYALYGSPISKIKADNLINNINQKGMMVTLEFERDGKVYKIERGRKPNILKLFVNHEELKEDEDISQGENRHTQEMIDNAIGMTNTMFKHIVALNTYTDPFLRMRAADQREVIEELLGVTQISARAETLKKLTSQTKESIRDQEATIRAQRETNARIQSAIDNAVRQSNIWNENRNREINKLTSDIDAMEQIDYDAEIALFDMVDKWAEEDRRIHSNLDIVDRELKMYARDVERIKKSIFELEGSKLNPNPQIARSKTEIDRKKKDIYQKEKVLSKYKEGLDKVRADLDGPDTKICVCCGQQLDGTDHLETVLKSLRDQESVFLTDIARTEKDIADIVAEVLSIEQEIETLKQLDEKTFAERETKLGDLKKSLEEPTLKMEERTKVYETWMKAQEENGSRPETVFQSRDEVYRTKGIFEGLVRDLEVLMGQVDPNINQIESLKTTLQEIDTTTLDEYGLLLKHQEFLLKLLTSKDSFIRKKIIDQNLSYLNGRMNHYLDKLGLPHEVRFMSDLTVEITLLGRDFDFEQLSRGEMNRVIMATSWSFRDVWESLNDNFNLLFVDEMLDQGTDGHGVEAALSILKGMVRDRGKNVFLISHRDDLTARIDRTLLVKKENGFTRFEEDALV